MTAFPHMTATNFPRKSASHSAAFTLIELLVTVGIIGVLAALVLGSMKSGLKSAASTREIAAAKTLITAYLNYPADNDGRLLPGYDRTAENVPLPDGTTSSGEPTAWRYAFRLAPYFDNKIAGVLLVNENAKQITPDNFYSISAFPAFGINLTYVGGDIQANGSYKYPNEAVTRQAEAVSVIAFATAAGDDMSGYCTITAPRETASMWDANTKGHVDARHKSRAICAFLDGSVQSLTIEDLQDMRLWSKNARLANNSAYTIATTGPAGGRR